MTPSTEYRNQEITKHDFGFWICNIFKSGRYIGTVRSHLYNEIIFKIDNMLDNVNNLTV